MIERNDVEVSVASYSAFNAEPLKRLWPGSHGLLSILDDASMSCFC